MPEITTDQELEAAQAVEYGTWFANKPINIRGARAFNTGDPVPASTVEAGVVSKDDVKKPSTKAVSPTTGSET